MVEARVIATRATRPTATALMTALGLLVLVGLWSTTASAAPAERGKIAFVRVDPPASDGDIWVMNDDGSEATRLVADAESPTWSPDGERIAFIRNPPIGDIWVINADGSGLAQLTQGAWDFAPAWSPDGERIAFVRSSPSQAGPPRPPPPRDIWVMNADGTDQANLTNNPDDPPYADRSPAWSPDGGRITFDSNRGWTTLGEFGWVTGSRIWAMNADGAEPAALTDWGYHDPAWSPGGEQIAFRFRPGGIGVMGADGSDQTRLTAGDDTRHAWSPDGRRIAFTTTVTESYRGIYESSVSFVSVVNADGSGLRRLIRDARSPTWSPDGRRIAFSLRDDIWAMNHDGSCLTPLTSGKTSDTSPAWRPLSPPTESQTCFKLSVSTSGMGTGGVEGPAISCASSRDPDWGADCAASFAAGTELTLNAYATAFVGWGGACTGTDPCRLTMDGDREVNAHFGAPRIRVRARPRQRRVGPDRRRVRYRFVARNVGDAPWRVRLCARDPQRRVRVLGKRCVFRQIPPGARRQRPVRVRIRPAARGKLNRIRLIARLGPGVENQQTFARLRVRR